ncbi:MAG: BspA family leucine-rich repeat surface protein [Bacteroides sp.]|nr:BspA family leucine-rich repeat surface protein [Bacteroides sp.]
MKHTPYILLGSLLLLLLATACEKDTDAAVFAPQVTTGTATDIYRKGATLSGSIVKTETTPVERYGILFSELQSMAEYEELNITTNESNFTVQKQNLEPGVTYYFCSYAYSGYTTVRGEVRSFTTSQSNAPVFSSVNLVDSTTTSVTIRTTVLDDGGSELMLSGFCYVEGTDKMPTFIDQVENATVTGDNTMEVTINGLTPGNTYRVRAYAATSKGVGYSEPLTVTMATAALPDNPEVAYLASGQLFNERIKQLANPTATRAYTDEDTKITSIIFQGEVSETPQGAVQVSADDSPAPIYASFNAADGHLTVSTAAKRMEIVDASYLCARLIALQSIDWGGFSINKTTTKMNSMFLACPNLLSLDVSGWDTSNVTDMSNMFGDCSSLATLDVSGWNTSNVTDMSYLFASCSTLNSLDVSSWNTSKVSDMEGMFTYCSVLSSLDVSSWDTSNVTNMASMFFGCQALAAVPVEKWDTSNVTDMHGMFFNCQTLSSLEVDGWNTSKVTDMSSMFNYCRALPSLDVSGWDVSKVTGMGYMFYECIALTSLDVSQWNTSNVTNMDNLFGNCNALTSLDVSNWNTSNVTDMDHVFWGCCNLTSLDVSTWDVSKVTDMTEMFNNCTRLVTLDVSGWDVTNVTTMYGMLGDCHALASLDLTKWSLNESMNYANLFSSCAINSQDCTITCTQDTQTKLLARLESTLMHQTYFSWIIVDATNIDTNIDGIPNEEW